MTCTLILPNARPPWTQLRGLIDTGADVTIISFSAWPPSWPLPPVGSAIAGLGGSTQTYLSERPAMVKDSEGHPATIRPIMLLPLPLTFGDGMYRRKFHEGCLDFRRLS